MRIALVIFDLDGTLVDSLLDLAASTNYVLQRLHLPELPATTVRDYVGEGARQLVRRSIGAAGAMCFDEALALFLDYYGRHLLDHTRPYAGIVELLDRLRRRGTTQTVLTNKPAAMTTQLLDGLHLADDFAYVLGGDSLATRKPDPAGVERLLQLSGKDRRQALLVGDSLVDRDTAAAARVAFCGVTWGFGSAGLRSAGVAPLVDTPEQVLQVVSGH
ncbi:MAG: HAD hydrolase-like protein [Deltaproteobacteria bacterium]|nr:HAD hydrolase-like protein [Deltaproteobacteria bacterium]